MDSISLQDMTPIVGGTYGALPLFINDGGAQSCAFNAAGTTMFALWGSYQIRTVNMASPTSFTTLATYSPAITGYTICVSPSNSMVRGVCSRVVLVSLCTLFFQIFLPDAATNKIVRRNADGTSAGTDITGLSAPLGCAFSQDGSTLYFTEVTRLPWPSRVIVTFW